jgi:hypothetical protein
VALLADPGVPDGAPPPVASIGGFTVSVSLRRRTTEVPTLTVSVDDVPESELGLTAGELGETALVTRLENRLSGLEHLRDDTAAKIDRLRAEVTKADELLTKPFAHGKDLAAARVRVQDVAEELKKAVAPERRLSRPRWWTSRERDCGSDPAGSSAGVESGRDSCSHVLSGATTVRWPGCSTVIPSRPGARPSRTVVRIRGDHAAGGRPPRGGPIALPTLDGMRDLA